MLASVAFGAGIVSEQFYTSLVLLAIVTSMITGTWLGRVARSGKVLRDEPHVPQRRPGTVARASPRAAPPPGPCIRRTPVGHFW